MGKPAIILPLLLAVVLPCLSQPKNSPKISHYDLSFSFDFKEEKLFGTATVTVENLQPRDTLPLLLYRLLKVKSVKDTNGQSIPFTQTVKAFDDWEQFQVNAVRVVPSSLVKTLVIEYDGYLKGYTETGMLYTKDHIDSEFTLLRPDCFTYPIVGGTSWEANGNPGLDYFDYRVSVRVPNSLTVVNGGSLVSKTPGSDLTTYVYTNRKPAWRIDIAIGKYRTFQDKDFVIHYFPEDSLRIRSVGDYVKKSYSLFESWFGQKNNEQYTIIEIPEKWGSQTDVTCILQEAGAMKDDKRMYELYHEISHIWNLTPLDPSPSRLESEGLAVFLQYLVMEKLHGTPGALDKGAERSLQRVKKQFEKDPKYESIPISEYGSKQLTDLSYSKGMLFFYSLYKNTGEEKFMRAIRDYYAKYRQKGATLKDFSESLARSLPGNRPMIDQWLFINKPVQLSDLVLHPK